MNNRTVVNSKIRLGLCCVFKEQPIRFKTVTAKTISQFSPKERQEKLCAISLANASALKEAILYCTQNGIGCFRINSQVLPLKTHPQFGYSLEMLGSNIEASFKECAALAKKTNTRLTFHPDQFVVLNSPRSEVVRNSLAELEYQAEIAQWVGADVINIHAGGGYGNKKDALKRLKTNVAYLSENARSRLTVENDDRIYSPEDLFPICDQLSLPLVYDVHHHRCNHDNLSVAEATQLVLKTWNREPLFHISSPKEGWRGTAIRSHADFIATMDFPSDWMELAITVEVEAKAKEIAVLRLKKQLQKMKTDTAANSS